MRQAGQSPRGKRLVAASWIVGGVMLMALYYFAGPCAVRITTADDARAADELWRFIIEEEKLSPDHATQRVWLKYGTGTGYWSRSPIVFVSGISERHKQDSILATIRRFGDSTRFRTVNVRFVKNRGRDPGDVVREEVVELK